VSRISPHGFFIFIIRPWKVSVAFFYFNEKGQKGMGCQQITPQSERIRRNYKKETELDEFEKT